jgi:hypothetical protein
MEILAYILIFVIGTAVSTLCLWAGMKITKVDGPILGLAITAAVSTLIGMIPIPYAGGLISYIVMCILIYKFTNADRIWPDVILMVLVARIVAIFGGAYLVLLLLSLFN